MTDAADADEVSDDEAGNLDKVESADVQEEAAADDNVEESSPKSDEEDNNDDDDDDEVCTN